MPFYDLHCGECGGDFNIRASVAEKTEKRILCPDCGSSQMQTVYGPIQVRVKSAAPACPNSGACGAACPHGRGR